MATLAGPTCDWTCMVQKWFDHQEGICSAGSLTSCWGMDLTEKLA